MARESQMNRPDGIALSSHQSDSLRVKFSSGSSQTLSGQRLAQPNLQANTKSQTLSTEKEHLRLRTQWDLWLIFGISLIIYALVGWVGAYVLQTYNWDGLARIAQAHGVFFSRDPHLAAIGFVWPPLPILSDLPLVLLAKPLGLVLFAGPLMSAVYGAIALVQLSQILQRFGIPRYWRLAWVVAFAIHPLVVQNAAMGLSEAPFMAFLFLSLNGFLMWEQDRGPKGILWAGIGAGLAVSCRYEALAWVAAIMAAIFWQWQLSWKVTQVDILEGTLLAFVTPPAYAMMLWAFMNWLVMGNPFHFLVGPGSTATTPDTARAVGSAHPLAFAQGSVIGSSILLLRQIADLAPLLLAATVLLVLLVSWRQRWSDLVYLPLGWSILGFIFLIALRGLLPPWSRYFFWVVPAGIIVASAAYRAAVTGWQRKCIAMGTALLLLIPSLWLSLQAWSRLSDPLPQRIVGALLMPPEVTDPRQVRGMLDEFVTMADYLNSQQSGTLTLLDAAIGSSIVFFLDRPYELVMTTDRDFLPILRSPVGQIDQVLVPRPTFDTRGRSDVLKFYPDIYEDGEPWARLVHEFPGSSGWRLFQVVPPH